ncbi:MAG: 30S ribosomal protein S24e [Methanobacteriota archaeon]|nr:MAG: 30S ribosomal protein S24e [Euryarchaeota archaeon]
MDVEIVSKDENELLERTEVRFKATHVNEGTPRREEVRDKIASIMKAEKERVIVDSMQSEFGKTETHGYAKVYKTKDAARKYEREHILVRNKLKEKAAPAKKAAPAEAAGKAPDKEEPKEASEKVSEKGKPKEAPQKPAVKERSKGSPEKAQKKEE